MTCRRALLPLLCSFAGLLAVTPLALAQQKPPINPQAPTLKPPVPLGVQRGSTLDLTLTGTNLAEPTGLWTSFPAKVTIPTEGNNGKDAGRLLVRLQVPADAPLGFHTLRLATRRGMSNTRLFCVDDLPQVTENATNHTAAMAQAVPVPCVVVGKADAETTDYFKITVAAGQRLSFDVLGHRLGSPLDPVLEIRDNHGRDLPGAYSNDSPGLQTDARLTYTFKEAGDYIVAIRDVSYRGGEDYLYRLRIGDFPCATTPFPLAARRGSKVAVSFTGPAVEGVAPVEVSVPSDPAIEAIQVAPRGANGLHGWPVSLTLSDLDETLEKEPNDEAARANRVPVPGAVTARFEKKGDVDYFVFALKKGTRCILEAHSQELHSPTEVYMVLRDGKGSQLQASNPAAAPRLDFTPTADGDFTLAVEHLHSWGGPSEVYRLTVTPYEPGFELTVPIDRFDVAQAGTVSIPLFLPKRDFGGPIEVSVLGPKGLSGQVTIPAGKAPPPNQPAGTLPLSAAPDVPMGPLAFRIQARATINGKNVVHFASVRTALSQGLGNLPLPPREAFNQIGLAVTERPPFSLAVKFAAPSFMPGKPAGLTITATRQPGFTGEIALSATGLPPNVKPMLKNVPANQNEIKAEVALAANAPVGQFPVTITGKAKHQGRDVSVNAPAVPLVIKK
jgi:hypothetical protein